MPPRKLVLKAGRLVSAKKACLCLVVITLEESIDQAISNYASVVPPDIKNWCLSNERPRWLSWLRHYCSIHKTKYAWHYTITFTKKACLKQVSPELQAPVEVSSQPKKQDTIFHISLPQSVVQPNCICASYQPPSKSIFRVTSIHTKLFS